MHHFGLVPTLKQRALFFEDEVDAGSRKELQAFKNRKEEMSPAEFKEWKEVIHKENEDRVERGRQLVEFIHLRKMCTCLTTR